VEALPGRPKIFRDSVHGDVAFPRDGFGKLVLRLLDSRQFQRLRGIRQNGVMNLVFPGAEHSRFAHSLGVSHVSGMMFDAIRRNMQKPEMKDERQHTTLAALLHDIGHGPFSHALEEITGSLGGEKYDHERMTSRLITDPKSEINAALVEFDPGLPGALAPYFEKKRGEGTRRWYYQLVSSQLDADRIDYLLRDARMAGVRHSFDHRRLIESLGEIDNAVVVDRRALDVAESYLLAIDQMYEAIYYHKTVRAASIQLMLTLKRAWTLAKTSPERLRALFPSGPVDPLAQLFEHRNNISLDAFAELDEHHVWSLIRTWQKDDDGLLRDLVDRLLRRRFLKPITLAKQNFAELNRFQVRAGQMLQDQLPDLDPEYYVAFDEPERVSYRKYTPREGPSGAIQVATERGPVAIEELPRTIVSAVEKKISLPRFIVHEALRPGLAAEFGGV